MTTIKIVFEKLQICTFIITKKDAERTFDCRALLPNTHSLSRVTNFIKCQLLREDVPELPHYCHHLTKCDVMISLPSILTPCFNFAF